MAKKKRKITRKKAAPRRSGAALKMPALDLHPRTRNWIISIGIGLLALLLGLSLLGAAGPFGQNLKSLLAAGFGWGAWFVPFILAGAGWMLLKQHEDRSIPGPMLVGGTLVLLAILGIFGMFGSDSMGPGGFVGYYASLPIVSALGKFAGVLIFLGIGAVGSLILWNFPHYHRSSDGSAGEGGRGLPGQGPGSARSGKRSLGEAASNMFEKVPSFKVKSIERQRKQPDADEDSVAEEADAEQLFTPKNVDASIPYEGPPLSLLDGDKGVARGGDIKANMAIIKRTFGNFHIPVEMGEVTVGPTVTQYTLRPAEGVKLSKIRGFENDLSLALAAHPIRIEAPIPGRSLVGIEVPNSQSTLVRLHTLLDEPAYKESGFRLPLALGRNVAGIPTVLGLEKMPHILVAGATGTGKTVGLNSLIMSLLYHNPPSRLRLILVDPKRVEFPVYNDIPHLITPVIVETEKTVHALRWAVGEMERRFSALSDVRARDIESYNKKIKKSEEPMPYIVIVIDELADLMASRGRDVEAAIVRLAQMARAVGIHLIVATQRPSVEVITGLIKANITTRVAFQVASQIDSRTIIDSAGAEKLLGNGDMLVVSAESSRPRRLQGAFISEDEVKRVADYLKEQGEAEYMDDVIEPQKGVTSGGGDSGPMEDDPLYPEAERLVIETRKASASYLQRRLRVGYARAARLLDLLEENGVVGEGDGAKPREILIDSAGEWEDVDTDDDEHVEKHEEHEEDEE